MRRLRAQDESNATCGKRLESIGLENTVENRQAYRELLVTTPGLGQYISGAQPLGSTLGAELGTGCTVQLIVGWWGQGRWQRGRAGCGVRAPVGARRHGWQKGVAVWRP